MNILLSIFQLILLINSPISLSPEVTDPDPHRFDKEIESFSNWDEKNSWPDNSVLFVGSSSIRLWHSAKDFPEFPVINRGFGGAHISDVNYFIESVVLKYAPEIIVFYAGDNDIAGEKPPVQVLEDYRLFVSKVHQNRKDTKIIFIPIKPSIARWDFWPEMSEANRLIKDYSQESETLYYVDIATPMLGQGTPPPADLFVADGLHLSSAGYQLWNAHLLPVLKRLSGEEPATKLNKVDE